VIATIAATLRADATFMAGMAGGLYDGVVEISRQTTPAAFDPTTARLKGPAALVKAGTATSVGPGRRAMLQVVRLFLYQLGGTSVIEPARRRAFALLHGQSMPLGPGEGTLYEIVHLDDDMGGSDDALFGAALIICRFQAVLMR